MLNSSQFSLNTSIAVLLLGPPLSGKTNVAFQFPDPYFLDCDDKLTNAVARNPGKKFWYDCPLRKEEKLKLPNPNDPHEPPIVKSRMVAVDETLRWEEAVARLKEAGASPDVKTIVIDSVTSLNAMIFQHILRFPSTAKVPLQVGGIKVMDQSMWGPYRDLWTRLIMGLRGTGKLVVCIAHDTVDKDEITGTLSYRPSWAGQLKDTGAGLFTDVWHCESRNVPDPAKSGQMKTEYFVRTHPTPMMALGNSLGLPREFSFTWEKFKSYLDAFQAKQQAPQV